MTKQDDLYPRVDANGTITTKHNLYIPLKQGVTIELEDDFPYEKVMKKEDK